MTTVRITITRRRCNIMCTGHATGKDPKVCASVSALVYSLAEYIGERSWLKGTVSLHDGYAFLNAERSTAAARGAFAVTALGLKQLAEAYPDYVRIEMERYG